LAIGAPGGSRITYTVLGALLSVMDFKMSLKQAIDAP
jgi:gamma-glutamyltranspeptidase